MKIRPKCKMHDVNLVGWPFLVDASGKKNGFQGPWELDLSDMQCPCWTVKDECQKEWTV